jgi:dCTP deaminase
MSILSDIEIINLCTVPYHPERGILPMISPFHSGSRNTTERGDRVPSYGLSSYGYDVTLGNDFKIFTNVNNSCIDPMDFDEKSFVDMHVEDGECIIIPPNSFILAVTKEYFCIPRDVIAQCLGKSTYARCGVNTLISPLEPEWEGHITMEFANSTTLPVKMYVGAGCAQIIFHRASTVCEVSYKDRNGKYQGQRGVTLPK